MLVGVGAINTALLLTSSLTAAWAARLAKGPRTAWLSVLLAATALLGVAFLGLKGYEYVRHYQDGLWPGTRFAPPEGAATPGLEMFFVAYYVLTGAHALHVTIGSVAFGWLARLVASRPDGTPRARPVELAALYWHFVDLVWIFLFPALYLLRQGP
jgi:cytochrome c oxidase subunit 3